MRNGNQKIKIKDYPLRLPPDDLPLLDRELPEERTLPDDLDELLLDDLTEPEERLLLEDLIEPEDLEDLDPSVETYEFDVADLLEDPEEQDEHGFSSRRLTEKCDSCRKHCVKQSCLRLSKPSLCKAKCKVKCIFVSEEKML